jgi:putative oxidoreductase
MLSQIFATSSDWAPTIARIILCIIFFAHGGQKMFGWFGGPGLKQTVRAMTEHDGIPAALAVCAIATQFFGGAALIVGLLGRVAALGIAVIMLFAIIKVHGKFGLFLNWFGDQKGDGCEYHLLAIALAVVVIFDGAGALSMDRLLSTWMGA